MQALVIDNLVKTYANGVQALKGINLSVEQGDFFALLGPNGAGKSTTIGIITSLVNKTSGTVKVFGHDLDTELAVVKSFIGLVPQEFNFNIFETVTQVLTYQAGYYGVPKKIALQRIEYYLNKLGLWDKRHQSIRFLSGGMKRRLLIARALIHEPKLLILDEPTAGVDIELRRLLWDFIREINLQGVTVILTTHYLEEAESLCRNITIIDQGHIIANEQMKSLLSKLHTQTFILDLAKPLMTAPILDGHVCVLVDPTTITVEVSKDQDMNSIFTELSRQDITVTSLRNRANRLEELFLNMTQKTEKAE